VPTDSVIGYCERCGRPHDIARPQPPSPDLGFDAIKSAFRYCSSCSLFVGRACCWNPLGVACIGCASGDALERLTSITVDNPAHGTPEERARRALGDLTTAVEGLGEGATRLLPDEPDADDREAARAWDDAWWTASWLIVRAESSSDAISKILWNGEVPEPRPRRRGRGRADAMEGDTIRDEFQQELSRYDVERRRIEQRLLEVRRDIAAPATMPAPLPVAPLPVALPPAAPPPAAPREWPPWLTRALAWRPSGRVVMSAALAVVFMAVVGLSVGVLGALVASWLGNATGTAPSPEPRGGVLGGAGAPSEAPAQPTAEASAPPAAGTPQPIAILAFDESRMGQVEPEGAIASVEGSPEIVAYPSPFDRSVRFAAGGGGICVASGANVASEFNVGLDLYLESAPGAAAIEVAMASAGGTSVQLPLDAIDGLTPERWYRASIVIGSDGSASADVRDREGAGSVWSQPLELSAASAGGDCLRVTGTTADAGLLVDNVEISG
jgi:hypothetical protein